MQVPHQSGQSHIEDGVIQIDDEGGSTEHHQGTPAVRMALTRMAHKPGEGVTLMIRSKPWGNLRNW